MERRGKVLRVLTGFPHASSSPKGDPPASRQMRGAVPVWAFVAAKGGVGVTCLAAAVSVEMARRELDVALVDLDPRQSGDLSFHLGPSGIAGMGSRPRLLVPPCPLPPRLDSLVRLAPTSSALLMDLGCRPAPLLASLIARVPHPILVMTPEPRSQEAVLRALSLLAERRAVGPCDLVLNQVRRSQDVEDGLALVGAVAEKLKVDLRLRGAIGYDPKLWIALRKGASVTTGAWGSTFAEDVADFVDRLLAGRTVLSGHHKGGGPMRRAAGGGGATTRVPGGAPASSGERT